MASRCGSKPPARTAALVLGLAISSIKHEMHLQTSPPQLEAGETDKCEQSMWHTEGREPQHQDNLIHASTIQSRPLSDQPTCS